MRHIIGIAEMKFAQGSGEELVTHALGSCVGIAIYDPMTHIGGILHYMLPMSSIDPAKAGKNPFMFGDTGIPTFFQEAYRLGARKENLRVSMAGGARVIEDNGRFDIGSRNVVIARKLFWKNAVMIAAEHVEGTQPRTLYLDCGSGHCWFTSRGEVYEL